MLKDLTRPLYTDIVGEVTIELARMIERALPGQILVGEFDAALSVDETTDVPSICLDAIGFMDRAQTQAVAAQRAGTVRRCDRVDQVLPDRRGPAPTVRFSIRKLAIHDKHGLTRNAFNAKINIYRREAEPILLGIEDRLLRETSTV